MDDGPETDVDATAHSEQLVNILLKDYELAASRFDKTDDRIIQLISVGLALFGLVVVLVRQAPGSSSGTALFPAVIRELFGQSASRSVQNNSDADVWLACVLFEIVYFILRMLCFYLWDQASKKDPYDKEDAGTNSNIRADQNASDALSADAHKDADSKLKQQEYKQEVPNPYELPTFLDVAWWSGMGIGLASIIFIGFCVKPTVSAEPNSRAPLELLWLAPLSLVVFHALLIYVTNSAFGLLWYCRALSKRITNVLYGPKDTGQAASEDAQVAVQVRATEKDAYLPVLLRFEWGQTPSIFFSFGRGNVKPRTIYVLLLGTIGFLFLWVTVASFINIYASHWWEGALMLAIYFALEFNVVFAFSGVGHDLETTHKDFVDKVDEISRKEAGWANRPTLTTQATTAQPDSSAAEG